MIRKIEVGENCDSDFLFIHDIAKYAVQRLELESCRDDNHYLQTHGLKQAIVSIISTVTINLFTMASCPDSKELEMQMIENLMKEITKNVVFSIREKKEGEYEH